MTTRTTTSIDASSKPAASSKQHGENSGRHAKKRSEETTVFIEANEMLDAVIKEQGLQLLMPSARKWLAKEFYGDSVPTLAELRLHAGLTQSELAKLTNQPQSSISRLESGSECPSIDRAHRIAQALNVSLDGYYAAWERTRHKGRR